MHYLTVSGDGEKIVVGLTKFALNVLVCYTKTVFFEAQLGDWFEVNCIAIISGCLYFVAESWTHVLP